MSRTLIQEHSSSIIEALVKRVDSIYKLAHKLTKGELREFFVSNVLNSFLTSQFSVGSGIIINQKDKMSNQVDIVVYDNRILAPFIKEQYIGVYPIESVIAAIEVKSKLTKDQLLKAEKDAEKIHKVICNPNDDYYGEYDRYKPLCAVIGFYGNGPKELNATKTRDVIKPWLTNNIKTLRGICLVKKYSWMKIKSKGWDRNLYNETFEEVKRFIAIIVDNIRTASLKRWEILSKNPKTNLCHRDWMSQYIRDQGAMG